MSESMHIELGSLELGQIEEYELDSDILTPADAFSVTLPTPGSYEQRRSFLAQIREGGLRLYAYIARASGFHALQMVGCIDKRTHRTDKDGTKLVLNGRDNGGLLASAAADPRLGVTSETTLIEMVRAVCEPFGIEVVTEGAPSRTLMTGQRVRQDRDTLLIEHAQSYGIPASQMRASLMERRALEGGAPLRGQYILLTDTGGGPISALTPDDEIVQTTVRARRGHASGMTGSDVEHLTVAEAKPAVGETCWDFIDRHCRRLGVLPWVSADGKLILSSPDYDQDPRWRIRRTLNGRESNVLAGGVVEDFGALASEVTVYGRTGGSDATRSPFHATETNARQPFYRPVVLNDPSVRSTEEATRRARRELNRQNEQAFVLEYDLHGHGQGDYVFAIDTVADVLDEHIGVEGLFYVTARTFRGSRQNGRTTRLRLIPLGAIVL